MAEPLQIVAENIIAYSDDQTFNMVWTNLNKTSLPIPTIKLLTWYEVTEDAVYLVFKFI